MKDSGEVTVLDLDEARETLSKAAEKLFNTFEASPVAKGYKAGFHGTVVLHSTRIGESIVILKLQAEKHPGDDSDIYAAFMLAHKDSTPPTQLFPLGYKITHSLEALDILIAEIEFDLATMDAVMTQPFAEA